jgi:GMP synthase-like glutamine amidotransferase
MNIHFIQHVPFEDLGSLKNWVYKPSNKVTSTRLYEDNRFPFVELFDLLIVLGGSMSVHDEDRYRWLVAEKALIKKAIEHKKKVVGVGLGAQLVAEVLGASVALSQHQEIGWFPVTLSNEILAHPLFEGSEKTIHAFHWHGESLTIPQGAIPIGYTEACEHQGFIWNNQVLALQFHLEITGHIIEGFIHNCPEDLNDGDYVQDHRRISYKSTEESNFQLAKMMDRFVEL